MFSPSRWRRIALVSVCVVASSLTATINPMSAPVAQAASGWPVQLDPKQVAGQLLAHPDGAVSVSGCRYRPDPTQNHDLTTYGSTGTLQGMVTSPVDHQIDFCRSWTVAGRSGMTYVLTWIPSKNKNYVTAYRNGTYQWSHLVSDGGCATSVSSAKRGMVAGPNGDLYLLLEECSQLFLAGVTASGHLKFRHNLGYSQDEGGQRGGQILAYRDGLVVMQNNAHNAYPTSIRWFDYSGKSVRRSDHRLADIEQFGEWAITYEGRLYLAVDRHTGRPEPCDAPWLTNRVKVIAPPGTTGVVSAVDHQLEQQCLYAGQIVAKPNGNAVIVHHRTGDFDRYGVPQKASPIYILAANGSLRLQLIPLAPGTSEPSSQVTAHVGLNDTLVAHRWVKWAGGGSRKITVSEWIVFDTHGTELSRYSSAGLLPTGLEGDTFAMPASDLWTVVNGAVYTVMCDTTFDSQECKPSKAKLHKLPFVEVSFDYLRGRLAGVIASVAPTLIDLVVLGDSFSSGEGNAPFDPSTDKPGNLCHRSSAAYAHQLARHPVYPIRLQAFVACSGAKSVHLTEPNDEQHELAQIGAITKDTDVVVMTIGGNDVDFKDFAVSCTYFDCTEGADDLILSNIRTRLGDALFNRFALVKQRVRNVGSSAKVYVLGYPWMVPPVGERPFVEPRCLQFDDNEANVILTVTDRLNQEIRLQAERADLTFMSATGNSSPFRGYELCTNRGSEYYFNGAMLPEVYSYHPNIGGQRAYAQLIEEALQR